MKAKLGPRAAHTAAAHKIAVIFYAMVKNQTEYDETIWEPPRHPSAPPVKSDATKATAVADTIPGTDRYVDRVEAFEGIVEPN